MGRAHGWLIATLHPENSRLLEIEQVVASDLPVALHETVTS